MRNKQLAKHAIAINCSQLNMQLQSWFGENTNWRTHSSSYCEQESIKRSKQRDPTVQMFGLYVFLKKFAIANGRIWAVHVELSSKSRNRSS